MKEILYACMFKATVCSFMPVDNGIVVFQSDGSYGPSSSAFLLRDDGGTISCDLQGTRDISGLNSVWYQSRHIEAVICDGEKVWTR